MLAFRRVLLLGLALSAVDVRPAEAWWRWLEEMSGPGWFDGIGYEVKILCRFPKVTELTATQVERLVQETFELGDSTKRVDVLQTATANLEAWRKAISQNEKMRPSLSSFDAAIAQLRARLAQYPTNAMQDAGFLLPGAVISTPCWKSNTDGVVTRARRHTLGASAGFMLSRINRLKYAEDIPAEHTQVRVVQFGGYYDGRVPDRWLDWEFLGLNRVLVPAFERLEFGATVEFMRFSGKTTQPFWRVTREVRGAVRIATFRDDETKNPVFHLKVRGGALWFNEGFAPTDFGAEPGPPLSASQVHTSVRILVDFECLPWRSNAC